jgi:hypothetical protein
MRSFARIGRPDGVAPALAASVSLTLAGEWINRTNVGVRLDKMRTIRVSFYQNIYQTEVLFYQIAHNNEWFCHLVSFEL